MRTHVEFVSDAFPAYPGEADEINPGIWGRKLVEFLAAQLPKYGVTPKEFYTEDWGWELPVCNEAFPMSIGCSNQLEPGGNHFLCFIDPSKPVVRTGWFKSVDTTRDIERLSTALDSILSQNPEIRELRWWDENEK